MNLHEWLDKPENAGKAVWLASQLGRSKTAVSLWRGDGVPLPLIPKIVELSGGEVTEDAMLRHSMARKIEAERARLGATKAEA